MIALYSFAAKKGANSMEMDLKTAIKLQLGGDLRCPGCAYSKRLYRNRRSR